MKRPASGSRTLTVILRARRCTRRVRSRSGSRCRVR
jgi:hypothetical protein